MKWDFIKDVLTILAALAIVELIRDYTGLPFTIIDITIFPLSVTMLMFGIKEIIFKRKIISQTTQIQLSTLKFSGYLLGALLFLALGGWAVYEGWHNPLTLYTGVKGAAHGYTLLSLGLLISAFSSYYIYLLAIKAIKST